MPAAPKLTVRPLTVDRLGDLESLFGTNKTTAGCYCMWFLGPVKECHAGWGAVNRDRFDGDGRRRRRADGPARLPRRRARRLVRGGPPVALRAHAPVTDAARPRPRRGRPGVAGDVLLRPARRPPHRRHHAPCSRRRSTLARRHGAPAIEGFPLAGDRRRSAGRRFSGSSPLRLVRVHRGGPALGQPGRHAPPALTAIQSRNPADHDLEVMIGGIWGRSAHDHGDLGGSGAVGGVAGEQVGGRVDGHGGVVHRGRRLAEADRDEPHLAGVLGDVAGGEDPRQVGGRGRVDLDVALVEVEPPLGQRAEVGGEAERGDDGVGRQGPGCRRP